MKTIPDFNNEQEEREFWEAHDTTDYMDWSKSHLAVFPNLKKTTKSISFDSFPRSRVVMPICMHYHKERSTVDAL